MLKVIIIIIFIFCIYSLFPTLYFRVKKIIQRKNKNKNNKIYLTFDDGPSSNYTNLLLDLLKEYNINASFFCVASFAKENPKIIKRMKEEGHLICLHSLKHESAYFMGITKTNNDFKESLNIMNDLNIKIIYYRPPWGSINLSIIYNIRKYKLKLILWNVMAEDWKHFTSSDIIKEKILKRTHEGDIICLHDGRGRNEAPKRTIEALKSAIPILLKKGYIFETVDNYEK